MCVSVAECYLATFQLSGGVPLPRGSLETRELIISSLRSEGVDLCMGTLRAIALNASVSRMSNSLRMVLRVRRFKHVYTQL